MATLLLLHSAAGLRPGVEEFAERLRASGHEVRTPDFYDGLVFDGTDGIAYRDRIGGRALLARLDAAIAALPSDAALGGFSLGAAFAQRLAADRPGAAAVFLMHHASGPRGAWSGPDVQVHRYAEDPWIVPAEVAALGEAVSASGARFDDHVVPGTGHLFTDVDDPDHDAAATTATLDALDAALRAHDASPA